VTDSIRLRFPARVNPTTATFDRLGSDAAITFLPMESIWPDARLDLSNTRSIGEVERGYTRFQEGDVLLPKITPTFEGSRATIARGLLNGVGAGTTELHVLRPGPELDSRFLFYICHSHQFLHQGAGSMFGVAGQQRVPENFVADFRIPRFGLFEQRRIADRLDEETSLIDRTVAAKRRQVSLLNERKTSLILDAVTGISAGRSLDREWLAFDADWQAMRIKDLVASVQGGDWGSEAAADGGVLVIRGADFDRSGLRVDPSRVPIRSIEPNRLRKLALSEGDLVLEKSGGGDEQPVGLAVWFDLPDVAVPTNFAARIRPSYRMEPRFLLFVFAAIYRTGLVTQFCNQTTGIQNLDVDPLLAMPWAAPERTVQAAIAEQLDRQVAQLDRVVSIASRQIDRLTERRRALISRAIFGEAGQGAEAAA